MGAASADRNLLFGFLALHNGFISREGLIDAVSAWRHDESSGLDQVLLQRQMLAEDEHALISALMSKQLSRHGSDPQETLTVISTIGSLPDELMPSGSSQLERTLVHVTTSAGGTPARAVSGGAARFRIVRPHAKGGLGEVFLAEDLELHREVALKEIQDAHAAHPTHRARFVLEAEVTGGLEHPGIVPIYGLGQYADGRPFYAMRFIRGESLKEAADRFHVGQASSLSAESRQAGSLSHESLEFRKLVGRFMDVCHAIEYAHSRGVLHRDLKPGNIMLGKYGESLVVDWGLAKVQGQPDHAPIEGETPLVPSSAGSSARTLMGAAVGTPAYMSPEQAAGELDRLGSASDVYSLGATFYYVLTGRAPFGKEDTHTTLRQVLAGEFPRPRQIKGEVPPALESICLKAMARQVEDRYASARELSEDLERYLADEPVSAHAEPALVRTRRWLRKHPKSVATMMATVVMGLTSLALIAVVVSGKNQMLARANFAERTARQEADRKRTEAETSREAERLAKLEAQTRQTEAETARADESQARKRSEAAFGYMIQTFRRPSASADGRTVSLASVLDRSVQDLQEALADEPHTKAALLNAIGKSYVGLGLYPESVAVFEQSLKLLRANLSAEHPDTLKAMNSLAIGYASIGEIDRAMPLFEETLKLRRATLGADHPDTLHVMNNLATSYNTAGQAERALALWEEVLTLKVATLGEQHASTLTTMHNLAGAYQDAGQHDRAIELFERTLAGKQAVKGPEDPGTLATMGGLANAYKAAGKLERAISINEEALKLLQERLGHDHPSTLSSMNNLALNYASAGNHDRALPLFEETLKLRKARLGLDHPLTRDSLNNLYSLADVYLSARQPEKALPLVESFLAAHRQRLEADQVGFAGYLANVSLNLLKHEQFAAAEGYLRECLTIRQEKAADDWLVFNTMSLLGGALAGHKDFAEAEPLLIQGYEGMKQREESIPANSKVRLEESLRRIVDLYTAWEKPEEAAKWKALVTK